MYATPRIALAMFIMAFVGVVRGLWAFPFLKNSLLFELFFPTFPRISGVRQEQHISLLFWRFSLPFSEKARKRRSGQGNTPNSENWAMIWGGCKTYGGRKTYQRTRLPKNSGPLQKSFWSAQSWIFITGNRATTPEGGGKRTV